MVHTVSSQRSLVADAGATLDFEPEFPSRYTVPLQTILAVMGLTDTVLEENDVFVLTLHGGAGRYKLTHDDGGGSEMMYTYHPNEGLCEGDGMCEWCGRTLW